MSKERVKDGQVFQAKLSKADILKNGFHCPADFYRQGCFHFILGWHPFARHGQVNRYNGRSSSAKDHHEPCAKIVRMFLVCQHHPKRDTLDGSDKEDIERIAHALAKWFVEATLVAPREGMLDHDDIHTEDQG